MKRPPSTTRAIAAAISARRGSSGVDVSKSGTAIAHTVEAAVGPGPVARVTRPMETTGSPPGSARPTFTAEMRGLEHGIPQLGRAADRRGQERTLVYRAVAAVARVPGLRRVAGAVPAGGHLSGVADDPDALLASPLYERLLRVRASDRYARLGREPVRRIRRRPPPAAAPVPAPPAPVRSQVRLGPWASRRTDVANDFLRRVPFAELQRRGSHFQPTHFYVPLNDVAFLRAIQQLWHDRGLPKGVDWDLAGQLEVART